MLLMVFALSTTANATIILDDWTIDLGAVTGEGLSGQISDIKQVTFHGIAHSQNLDTNNDGIASVGDFGFVDGHLVGTSLVNSGGSIIPGTGLNDIWEITFDFSVDGYNWAQDPVSGAISYTHIGPLNTDGILDIYVDNLSDGSSASTGTGDGYTDGTLVGSFLIQAGDGGIFTPTTFDGSDDATFTLISAMAGVFLDADGNDLSLGALLGITDSNFDADFGDLGYFSQAAPSNWGAYFAALGGGTQLAFYALEDGSATLATIPEPATLLLLGAGLLGIGAYGRRKMKK